jgi:hypothetical protein
MHSSFAVQGEITNQYQFFMIMYFSYMLLIDKGERRGPINMIRDDAPFGDLVEGCERFGWKGTSLSSGLERIEAV